MNLYGVSQIKPVEGEKSKEQCSNPGCVNGYVIDESVPALVLQKLPCPTCKRSIWTPQY